MQVRLLGFMLTTAALALAACTNVGTGGLDDTDTSTLADSTAPRQLLAILDESGSVVIITQDGREIARATPAEGQRLAQPTWTSATSVTFIRIEEGRHGLSSISVSGEETNATVTSTPPFYLLPSPGGNSGALSLRNTEDGSGLVAELVGVDGGIEEIARTAPYYGSWDPDGERLSVHAGGNRLAVIGSDEPIIEGTASGFQAPVWLDRGLVTLRSEGDGTSLAIWDGSRFTSIAGVASGSALFVGAGDRVAVVTGGVEGDGVRAASTSIPQIPEGALSVVDLGSGSVVAVSREPVVMFQWDTAGEQLLYAVVVDADAPTLQWRVWTADGTVTLDEFQPNPRWFGTIAPFFDQYAQSMSLWSPDGRSIAYPTSDGNGSSIVVRAIDGAAGVIADGSWVSWAPAP